MATRLFLDRVEAGNILGSRLTNLAFDSRPLVLALPRGGVPVGFEVAQALQADLDVFMVRKLGVPGHEELAMGAIASGGVRVLNERLIAQLGLSTGFIDHLTAREEREIERRERLYREGRPPYPIASRTLIMVDDGLATGATMLAAVRAVGSLHPERIIVAAPVGSREACQQFRQQVDDIVCVHTPEPFYGVGYWYQDFSQTSDAEVQALLERAANDTVA